MWYIVINYWNKNNLKFKKINILRNLLSTRDFHMSMDIHHSSFRRLPMYKDTLSNSYKMGKHCMCCKDIHSFLHRHTKDGQKLMNILSRLVPKQPHNRSLNHNQVHAFLPSCSPIDLQRKRLKRLKWRWGMQPNKSIHMIKFKKINFQ